jgi:cellulose synthase (UDP-forming)
VAALAGIRYLWWRLATLSHTGVPGAVFFSAEALNYVGVVFTAVALARVRHRPSPPLAPPAGTLDVFVTVCGEPEDMVAETVRAALAIVYPHATYVLNDGRVSGKPGWRNIDELCRRLDVPCFTRTAGGPGKAANLNHALALTDGEFILTLDADHHVSPTAATEILGWFADPKVSFVCTRQSFDTEGHSDVLNNEEAIFYGVLQRAKDADDCAFSCGNGTVYRRSALASMGGFSEWSFVEDLHTSYCLHAAGWTSVYHPLPVTLGTAPVLAAEYARQRLRWAMDSLRLLIFDSPVLRRGMRSRQRMHYLHTTSSYLVLATQTIFLTGPPLYLLARVSVLRPTSSAAYLDHVLPYLVAIAAMLAAYVGLVRAARTAQSAMFAAPVYVSALILTLAGRRPGGVTAKVRGARASWLLAPQTLALGCLVAGVAFAAIDHRPGGSPIAVVWGGVMAFLLVGPLAAVSERPRRVRILATTGRAIVVILVVAVLLPGLPLAFRTRVVPPRQGAYLGVSADGLPEGNRSLVSWVQANSGLRPQLVQWFQQWRSGETAFRTDWAEAVAAQGAIPLITWEPWAKPPGGYVDPNQPTARLQRILDGIDDDYIRLWARAAAAYRRPILLRFMHELNGSWYPWSIGFNGNTAAQSVAVWRRLHDIFVAEGATNVSWVWSVQEIGNAAAGVHDLLAAYPGANYVDWIGISGINVSPAGWRDAGQIFGSTYRLLAGLGRPFMVAEVGTQAGFGDQAAWVVDAMTRFRRDMPAVKAVVWLDRLVNMDFRFNAATSRALAREAQSSWWRARPVRARA